MATIGDNPGGQFDGVCVTNQGVTTSLYMSNFGDYVYRFDNTGSGYPDSPSATFGGPSILGQPEGLVTNSDGTTLYVADYVDNKVEWFNTSNPGSYGQAVSVTTAHGITRDLAGNYYVTDRDQYQLLECGANLSPSVTPNICQFPGSSYPWGVAVDGTGRIFVSEYGTTAVTVLQSCVTEPAFTPTPSYTGANPPGQGQCFIFPSPVRGDHASVSYSMAESGGIKIRIFNRRGELETEVDDHRPSGVQATPFSVSGFSPGIYFYTVTLDYDSGKSEKLKPGKFAVVR
jgi:DNA-binding beta-propeller fold protein YncE